MPLYLQQQVHQLCTVVAGCQHSPCGKQHSTPHEYTAASQLAMLLSGSASTCSTLQPNVPAALTSTHQYKACKQSSNEG